MENKMINEERLAGYHDELMKTHIVGGCVFDISAYHATGTPPVLAEYADLSAALGTNGANVPESMRNGGMSVKFVSSSDHKYIQYRLMSDTFNTTPANWQGVDDKLIAGSKNLVESGAVWKELNGTYENQSVEIQSTFADGKAYNFGSRNDGDTFNPTSGPSNFTGAKAFRVDGLVAGDRYTIDGYANSAYQGLYVITNSSDEISRHLYSHARDAGTVELTINNSEAGGHLYVNLINYDSTTDKLCKIVKVKTSDGINDKIEDLQDNVSGINEGINTLSQGIESVNGKIDEIVTEREYGLKSGYTLGKISGDANLTSVDTEDGVQISKDASVNVSYRFGMTAVIDAGTYAIHVESDKAFGSNDSITIYKDGITQETKQCTDHSIDFTYQHDGNSVLGIGSLLLYNISTQKVIINIKKSGTTDLQVIADNLSQRVDNIEGNVTEIGNTVISLGNTISTLNDKVNNQSELLGDTVVDKATVDYGLLAGYIARKISGAYIIVTDTETGVHLAKSDSTNANWRFDLTNAPNTLLRIKYKSNKDLPSSINIYIDGTSVATESIPANSKEYEFTYNFSTGSVLSLGYTMAYNISSVDLDINAYVENATGLKVIADSISERVEDIEENLGTPIPHIISDENTFIGDGAGILNERSPSSDNGRYNTAMGKNAMRYNTAGDHCTAVGFCAMNKNTSGRNNTAFGEDALYENQTTGQNVAVGQHSLQDLTQGGYNVAIGSNAGRRTANAISTVIIGAEAYNTDDETGCDNSVIIGAYQRNTGNYDSVVLIHSDEPTADGQVRIGNPSNFSALFIGGKKINFNQDGSVTWEEVSNS